MTYVIFSECSLNTTLDAPVAQDHILIRKSLTTPYWPYGYRINTTCGWYIRAPENHIIVLEYGYYFCTDRISSEDSLRIYNVEGSELLPIRRFRRKWDISVSPLVYILFESDGQLDKIRDQGLCLQYMATKTNTDSGKAPKIGVGRIPVFREAYGFHVNVNPPPPHPTSLRNLSS